MPAPEATAYLHGVADGVAAALSAVEMYHETFTHAMDRQLLDPDTDNCECTVSLGILIVIDSLVHDIQHLNNELEKVANRPR